MIRELAESQLEKFSRINSEKERFVDKIPDNYLYAGFLSLLFPNASFVHCRRNLCDTALSRWITDFESIDWANDVKHIVSRFKNYSRLIEHWRNVPLPVHEVVYEDLVADFPRVSRELLSYCGLGWEEECLVFNQTQSPVHTASMLQVRQPIYVRSVERWKNYKSFLPQLFVPLLE